MQTGDAADYSGAFDRLDDLARSVHLSGDTERAAQLDVVQGVMLSDGIAWGTPPNTIREITDALHGASATLTPMSDEQLADGYAKGMRELADMPIEDIDLARDLIRKMEGRIPNLASQLEASGLGSDPKFVRLIVAEAKRRAAVVRR